VGFTFDMLSALLVATVLTKLVIAAVVAVETDLFKSEVLSQLPKPTIPFVMPATVPVKAGLARGAFKFRAVCVAVEIGLFASEVLSQLPKPMAAFVTVLLTALVAALIAAVVAVETGLFKSEVLSQLPKPTTSFVMPATVPVKVGLARGAFKFRAVCVAVETGLFKSEVLSQLPKPTIAFVIP
jgi:hypothetical protein